MIALALLAILTAVVVACIVHRRRQSRMIGGTSAELDAVSTYIVLDAIGDLLSLVDDE